MLIMKKWVHMDKNSKGIETCKVYSLFKKVILFYFDFLLFLKGSFIYLDS